ncbi:unnamed protein product [Didymodactylos carnosus]|uniref:Uncharacterized protein n=1 Tax=Didymodactylos carnosus TaxID=1234261 RepID=A0A8S2EF21_9BILA|nr:unnamed protein product [Didymodactylos carnosus]CAF3947950.1 unnamed protein product [Didymodactylos carnosus]
MSVQACVMPYKTPPVYTRNSLSSSISSSGSSAFAGLSRLKHILNDSIFSENANKVKREREKAPEPVWPNSDQGIVRHLIDLQKFDGLWDLTNEQIEKLTNKSLSSYQSQHTTDQQIISSTIVIVVLEQKRFEEQKKLWQACADKTKRRLTELLSGNDRLELLLQEIRGQVTTDTSGGNFFTRLFK